MDLRSVARSAKFLFLVNFDPGQPRDKEGKWSRVGGKAFSGTTVQEGRRLGAGGEELPEHVQRLKLPPAWTDVVYNPDPNGTILVKGRDAKGRPQYMYSEKFVAVQAATKFARVAEMDAKFKGIARQNEANRSDPTKREQADCLKLIMETGIRPGSTQETLAKTKAYGATTLEGRHVVVSGSKVTLKFTGKKGVALAIPVENKGTASMLRARAAKAGPNGKLFGTSDGALRAYTHTLDGGGFKTKDFRTHLGTSTAAELVRKAPVPKTVKEYKKAVRAVAVEVSRRLGNTPVVALESYINPSVFAGWRLK